MSQLLLDPEIVVDLCVERPGSTNSRTALSLARAAGQTLWVYVGSVSRLEDLVTAELAARAERTGDAVGHEPARARARERLRQITADYQWLAALASEGDVFDDEDPEGAQLLRALDRFTPGSAALLTRDPQRLACQPERTLTPEALIAQHRQDADTPAQMDFVDLRTQQAAVRASLERNLHRVLHHGQYILGPEVRELERRLADYTGSGHCITAASGTEALLISLMALGIGPGDEVITTPFTFVATVEVIVLVGATPIFVDIEPGTANIDASLIEARITDRTRAILPVSLYGQPADMDAINAIAARHGGIPVIEDAAQSFGAVYRGRKSGNLSTLGCTSFFPSKPLGGYGDGGAIFTNDDALAQACREIRVHGQSRRYVHTRVGVGGRMDTMQCAVVLAKLERFEDEITRRQVAARRYHERLGASSRPAPAASDTGLGSSGPAHAPIALLPWPTEDRTSVFAQYTIMVQDRERLQAELRSAGIPTAVHYPVPLNEQPAYAQFAEQAETPIARRFAEQVMCLPMHADLTEAEQDRIVAALQRI